MTSKIAKPTSSQQVQLQERLRQGAVIGLILISFILIGAGDPDPDWPKSWIIRPLVVVPLAGAIGGMFYYFIHHASTQAGWKFGSNVLSLTVYLIALWLGVILGLDGTMWD